MRGDPIVLRAAARALVTLFPVVAIFLLVRGHNFPGGGFIAALLASAAVGLFAIAYDPSTALRLMRVRPTTISTAGIATAVVSGLPGLLRGEAFLTGYWAEFSLIGLGVVKLGTPLLFDVGVFLAVLGAATTVLLLLEEESPWR